MAFPSFTPREIEAIWGGIEMGKEIAGSLDERYPGEKIDTRQMCMLIACGFAIGVICDDRDPQDRVREGLAMFVELFAKVASGVKHESEVPPDATDLTPGKVVN